MDKKEKEKKKTILCQYFFISSYPTYVLVVWDDNEMIYNEISHLS